MPAVNETELLKEQSESCLARTPQSWIGPDRRHSMQRKALLVSIVIIVTLLGSVVAVNSGGGIVAAQGPKALSKNNLCIK